MRTFLSSIRAVCFTALLLAFANPTVAQEAAADLAGYIEKAYAGGPEDPLPQSRDLPPLE